MSTTPQTFEGIKGHLNQISHHLLQVEAPLLPEQKPVAELAYLEKINGQLTRYRQQYMNKSQVLYIGIKADVLPARVATLKTTLNTYLQQLDRDEQIDGKPRKSYMTFEAGFSALAHETKLSAQDRLLHPQQQAMLERVPLGSTQRPGLYALSFQYQERTVELAGAFVLTQQSSPLVADLDAGPAVGEVMLFTPSRGIASFSSLAQLNRHLLQGMDDAEQRRDFMQLLPVRYHDVSPEAIWPLQLAPISDRPLFEHTYNALIDKRTQDIEHALSLVDNPTQSPAQLISALDRAIAGALPDLRARLAWRARRLLERHLRHSAPDWYRSASEARRATLATHLWHYNEARQDLLDLLGPVTTPQSLARYQLLERLSDELDIQDLAPEHLLINTRRYVYPIGEYEHDRSLVDLALRGLQDGDALPGSDFLNKTTLTYQGATLPTAYQDLTPTWLAQTLATLQPRIDFADAQRQMHAKPEVSRSIERMLDQRLNALAYTALLQGHLSDEDFQLVQDLRQGTNPHLSAATLSLHAAQLQDLWVLRQSDASGAIIRLLLCTPEAPRAQQFMAFDSELACQNHILGWSLDNGSKHPPGTLTDYLIKRVALRFRGAMKQVLSGLSFKFHDQEYQEIGFGNIGSHAMCLKAMSAHVLATRIDDYEFGTPSWYRSASVDNRQKLLKLAEDSEGALLTYNEHPLSDARFPSFTHYLHEQARKSLNDLLDRPQNDVDPDTVWAFSPPSLLGALTPPPLTYTQLYRDGYADGVGFLDEKFSRSARFKGPPGVDLSQLSAEKIARSVTGTWVGERYINQVKTRLLNTGSTDYALRRNATLSITQHQLQNAALECRLEGYIAGVDWTWLQRSIASMHDTAAQTRGTYAIHRLLVDGEWVMGNLLFSHGDFPTLLYTPNAPDGISFREARLFNYRLKKIPGMVGYFTLRVGAQSQVRVRAFLENAKAQLPEDLSQTDTSPARYDSTHGQPPLQDLREALYNMPLQRKIDDVQGTTVNRNQMISAILWNCVEWVTAIATAPFPSLSLSLGMLLAFKDGMLALHAYQQGDTGAALEHLLGYVLNSAGAAVTDLRPALASVKQLARPGLRQVTRSHAAPSEAVRLVQPLQPKPLALENMQAVLFEGQALWAKTVPDPIGRYLLYRLDPVTGRLVSTTRVAAPDSQGVWRRTGVTGGAPKYEKLPEPPEPLKAYEMLPSYARDLGKAINPDTRAQMLLNTSELVGSEGVARGVLALDLNPLRTVYLQQVERLSTDAQDFFTQLAPLPARPAPPAVDASTSFAQLIASDAFSGNKNLIIGAIPGSIASKQLLITQMDALISNGFKHLYIEYLPADAFRTRLQRLHQGKTWENIRQHLEAVDKGFGLAPDAEYSYLALVRKAKDKGVKILALDASTSYLLDDFLQMRDTPPTIPRSNSIRNFYSHKAIGADALVEQDERWVALVDHSRLRTFEGTPGLADLQEAVALRVEDVAAGQPVGLWVDTPGAIAGDPLAKGDYRLALHTAYKEPGQAASASVASTTDVTHFSDYDIPHAFRDSISRQSTAGRGLDSNYASPIATEQRAFSVFLDARERLSRDAAAYLEQRVPPARPDPSTLGTPATPQALLERVGSSEFSGLVVGEAHQAQSSKRWLREHMKKLKEQAFKTLYVEHLLTDMHQQDLDLFLRTQHLPDNLKRYLAMLDRGQMPHYKGKNSYTEVIQVAARHGLRIRALDCTASYNVKGLEDGDLGRNQMFSYFASKVIQADQAAQGPHKWVAFIGSAHTNNNLGVAGLAELQGAVSLHVRDTAPALAQNIRPGTWEVSTSGIKPFRRALRGDLVLEAGVEGIRAPAPFVPVDRRRLNLAGLYLIERPSPSQTNLLHRSRSGEIVSTPIKVDHDGLFYVERWAPMQGKRFSYENTLISALEVEVGLKPAPDITRL
ncbi:membrane-targeted effector domain-containing toxin [Pseudomonas sp. WS 5059]|uniref:membrane-targeted effector domain-containing toxin n=1 Tax=Pseudomonas sp. WS 5059 TaxID=2717491 RepID=UPI001474D452|nr:membrane-targeted effector domain-containing toxin [Pseudomonas sp. WS 5059]NMY05120.1 membrane-targeted effector domain-containing toxin [Pseudomonas sp. WS 5059]